ncbi:HmuY family protein [Hymenobacter cellulosilyticus]|uniref:HmuY family protein n=1 Tax=Hymenobacter cellulosilyticus TaxID=2932248 RepID=A0A8T9QCG6_9BACT|nr:HmuY family protein [Hymenobacter cellulosilyticus]UOQ74061.1 HmuY family protein [Hymenobacter cellulosilyticus]
MNHLFLRAALATVAISTLGLTSCNDDDEQAEAAVKPALQVQAVSSLAPQPATPTSTGQPGTPRHYTFFSLADGKEVPHTDSASTKWDLAFRGTTILTNGGSSGPGQGGAQVKSGLFAELTTAPETDYAVDAAAAKAIPTGSGKGWYNYNPTTHVVSPIAGKVLVIRTAAGKYAKLEVTNYYKGAPATPTGTEPSGYYSFRYVYQPDGSRNLQ